MPSRAPVGLLAPVSRIYGAAAPSPSGGVSPREIASRNGPPPGGRSALTNSVPQCGSRARSSASAAAAPAAPAEAVAGWGTCT